jgi:hypothetical protein
MAWSKYPTSLEPWHLYFITRPFESTFAFKLARQLFKTSEVTLVVEKWRPRPLREIFPFCYSALLSTRESWHRITSLRNLCQRSFFLDFVYALPHLEKVLLFFCCSLQKCERDSAIRGVYKATISRLISNNPKQQSEAYLSMCPRIRSHGVSYRRTFPEVYSRLVSLSFVRVQITSSALNSQPSRLLQTTCI